MEEVSDQNAICRLCLEDLTQFTEYYEIDDNLSEILLLLTTISTTENENLSICMCPNCFNILSTFNETKQTWLNNQQILIESNGELISEEIEVQDENLERYEVEYVDEVEEHELISENHDEGSQDECVNRRKYEKKKTERTASEKAKEVYKSLLKKCEECGKMIEKNRLEGHINKHLGKKPFICEFKNCGKAFYCRLLRRLHQTSIHTGTLVACEQCEKTFKSERSLYTHSLRHRNANRYKCDHCEKSFNNSNSLKRHLAIHSGVREWKCDQCSSSFYRKFNLDVHVKTVHEKEKSYSCQYCTKKFGYSRLLRVHITKFHENVEDGALPIEQEC